ncbi:Cytochrome [Forsythia ovata]|uniref:Cytochrome n=1 Tax=Forsythia ovata TaxID=205694 RepID=A0ABD1RND0_9LAMI
MDAEYTRSKYRNATQKLPPGPWKLPFIGNLHQLVGSLPHRSLQKLAQKYGPIMTLQVGELSTVVISSPRLAEEAMKKNGVAFANRPEVLMSKVIFYNSVDLGSSKYGEYWRQMRKLFILELLSSKKVHSFNALMEEEVSRLLSYIRSSEGLPINVSEKVASVSSSITCRAVVGRRCKDQESITRLAKETASYAGVFNVGDIFPSLYLLDSVMGSKQKLVKMHKKIDNLLEDIIREHEDDRLNSTGQSSEEDILDLFLHFKDEGEFQFVITRDNIKANVFELFTAGTDTSATVIEWAMAELMKNPTVMKKAQSEVRQAFEGKENFTDSDIRKLNYLNMVIKESLRLHPPLPLLGARSCREKCTIDGYDIPVNTVALVNAWSIGRDPKYWHNPESFEPERFSNSSVHYTGNHYEYLPFGAGRRICPGITFGVATVELVLAKLLYHFDWKLPDGISPEELDMTENFGAIAGRKNGLYLIPKSYIPSDG